MGQLNPVLMGLWNGQAKSGDAPIVQHIDEGSHIIDLVSAARDGTATSDESPTWEYRAVTLEFVPVVVEPGRVLPPPKDAGAGAEPATGRIEIALTDGSRVIVARDLDCSPLARILSVRHHRPERRTVLLLRPPAALGFAGQVQAHLPETVPEVVRPPACCLL